jgi:phage terminase small subunit
MAHRRNRKRPLSLRQQKFVEQFLLTGIAREAAIRAGYVAANAGKTAWRLRRRPHVAEAIRLGRSAEARRAQVGRERVLLELARIAFSDIGELLDWDGDNAVTLRPKAEISPHLRAAVQEIAAGGKGKPTRVRLHGKAHAIDAIARHLGLFDKTPPMIDLPAQRRDRRDARTILLERFARLSADTRKKKEEAERAEASLNAGAPLGLPAAEADSSLPSPPSSGERAG